MLFQYKTKIGLALIALIALRCIWLWQPERQVLLHQRHLLDAAQDRNWLKLNALLDDGFRTSSGIDKTTTLQLANEALRPFLALQIVDSDTEATLDGRTARVRSVLRIQGNGMALAEMVKMAVNQSKEPFTFTWKRASWKPWDWRLVGTEHPLMNRAASEMSGL